MPTELFYPLLILVLCYTDIRYLTIPNIIVLPAIALGGLLTGNWLMATVMFLVGVLLYRRGKVYGGDVKLLTMVGVFLGLWAIPTFILAKIFIFIVRKLMNYDGVLPYAPFVTLASLPFIFM